MRRQELSEATCSIAQALAVVGDAWSLLVVRDVAGGVHRFDALQAELGLSRRTLSERLARLVAGGVLERRRYHLSPPRDEYHLTEAGRGLMPVLVSLQDWGSRHVLGDGTLTATAEPGSTEARRVAGLVGTVLPDVELPAGESGTEPLARAGRWTVLAGLPGAVADPAAYPPSWGEIPGAPGCTLEATTLRDLADEFADLGADVRALSTAPARQSAVFARSLALDFPVLSDAEHHLVTALRLPTFHAAGRDHLKRVTLVVDPSRTVRAVLFPIRDPAGSVLEALDVVARGSGG